MFRIVDIPIEELGIESASAGGFVTFDGKVRDWSEGRPVLRLEYEAYAPMAEAEGQKILDEATRAFGLTAAAAAHRVGPLEIGETAVRIEVAASHRAEAFRACEYIIDELKRRVPIWKKEHYADGDSGWVGVHEAEVPAAFEFYRRQEILAEIGRDGQEKLGQSRVLVVGAGGLGSGVLPYLAAAGVGTIGICDGDEVEVSNLHRQVVFGFGERGMPKAERAAAFVGRLNPLIRTVAHDEWLELSNAEKLVEPYDVVVDGTDNFAAKFLLNDICWALRKPLVQASIHRFEGQLLVVAPASSGGCLRCLWPEAPYDGCVGTCAEEGVLGVVPGVLGVLQANEVLKLLLGWNHALAEELLLLDLRTYAVHKIARTRRQNCPTCGAGERPDTIDVEPTHALRRSMTTIDIREPEEWDDIEGFDPIRIPMSDFDRVVKEASKMDEVLLICEHGIRSAHAARWLRQHGVRAYSLLGGADRVRKGG